jgi:hypothetical protein
MYESLGVMAAIPDAIKTSHAVLIADNCFPIDDAGSATQPRQGFNDERETIGQIVAGSAVQPDVSAIPPSNAPDPVVFDFMHPNSPGGRFGRAGG